MKSRQEKLCDLVSIGQLMANSCYNLSQKTTLSERDKKVLKELQESWDKKLMEVPKALELSDKTIAHIMKIIQKEVAFFNGWRVDEKSEIQACTKAASKVIKYLKNRI